MSEKHEKPSGEFEPDPARYRKASEPHTSPEAADEAVGAFLGDVAELRVKHKIRDLLIVYGLCLIERDGSETSGVGISGFGNQSLWESMAACAYGREKAARETRIRHLLSAAENDT